MTWRQRRGPALGIALALGAGALAVISARHLSHLAAPRDRVVDSNIPIVDVQRALRVSDTACGGASSPPSTVGHVLWIWMENENGTVVDGSPSTPYLSGLGAQCGVASAYTVIGHPSLPNYLGATSGLPLSALGPFVSDCQPASNCQLPGTGMFGLVPSWKAYEESMPMPCAPVSAGSYLVRHNPPAYYADLVDCAAHDVSYDQLATDLATGQLPAFSFVTPNRCHDMHNCSIGTGDAWLASEVPKLLTSDAYRAGQLVVFITFDEGRDGRDGQDCAMSPDPTCHVLTVVVSPWTVPGTRTSTPFSHYSLLRTTLELLGVGTFPGSAATAASMRSAFSL